MAGDVPWSYHKTAPCLLAGLFSACWKDDAMCQAKPVMGMAKSVWHMGIAGSYVQRISCTGGESKMTAKPTLHVQGWQASSMSQRQPRRITIENKKHFISAEGAKAGGIIRGRDEELGTSPGGGLGEGVALSDVKTWLPEVGLRSTNSFHTAPQTDTLPFLRSTDAYIYLNHCSSQGLY